MKNAPSLSDCTGGGQTTLQSTGEVLSLKDLADKGVYPDLLRCFSCSFRYAA